MVAFVFPGHGTPKRGMGQELFGSLFSPRCWRSETR
jgi:hypothetical protein